MPFVEAAARWPRARLAALGAPQGATVLLERRLLGTLCRVTQHVLAMPGEDRRFPRRNVARLSRAWPPHSSALPQLDGGPCRSC